MTKRPAARIYRGTSSNLARLAARLQAGELVAVPTETVYGLAANALNPAACRKIFAAKGRPTMDPLIVHIHSIAQLGELAESNAAALTLARAFWPGPLTLVLPRKPSVPDVVTAGRPNVAVRMPSHPLFRRLLKLAGVPLAAPSANPFGYLSPTTAAHVRASLGKKIAHILDGGPSRIGVESTIVDLRYPKTPRLLRPGAISQRQLERVLRRPVRGPEGGVATGSAKVAQLAPGMLARHYSPRTALVLHAGDMQVTNATDAFLFVRKPAGRGSRNVFWLDARGKLPGAARQLFATLRRLDGMGFKKIHVELAAGGELAAAINDRLRRAAAR